MSTLTTQFFDSLNGLSSKVADWIDLAILQIPNFILAVLVGSIAYFLRPLVKKVSVRAVRRFTGNRTVVELVGSLSVAILGLMTLFVILGVLNLGETINKILATAGVLGLAVGLALQEPMNNFFSGVFMSVRDLYNVGDLVESNGYFGTISNIDLRATTIQLPTGQEVVVPNKDVIQQPLTNYSSLGKRRVDLGCGVSYDSDLDRVEQVAVDAVLSLGGVLDDESVKLTFNEFGDSSINFQLMFWISIDASRGYLEVRSDAIKAVKHAFEKHNISIPYPTRTIDLEASPVLQGLLADA